MTKSGVLLLLKHKSDGVAAKFLSLAAALFFTLTVFSCKSAPKAEPVDALNLIDCKAPLLIYIPVKANEEFVKYAIASIAGLEEKDAGTIAGRADVIAISTGVKGEYEIAIEGSFPKIGINSALTEKKGWKQSLSTETTIPLSFYSSKDYGIQVASPDSSLFLAAQNVHPVLKRYENEQHRLLLAAEGIDDTISKDVMDPVIYEFLKDNQNQEIRFYSQQPASFIKTFLGKVVGLGIDNLSGTLVQSKADKTFALKLDLELSSGAVTKAAVKMLKVALFPIPAKIVQTGAMHIQITDISLTYKQLIKLITQ